MADLLSDPHPSEDQVTDQFSCQACRIRCSEAVVLQAFSVLAHEGHRDLAKAALAAFEFIRSAWPPVSHTMIAGDCGAFYASPV